MLRCFFGAIWYCQELSDRSHQGTRLKRLTVLDIYEINQRRRPDSDGEDLPERPYGRYERVPGVDAKEDELGSKEQAEGEEED